MAVCNVTETTITETPLWKGFTFHHFGLFLSAAFALLAIGIAFFLIFEHATHYSNPHEQRHIIRILFMIPIYAAVSFLSYYYYNNAIYFEVLRDCYEAFAISSFFALLCAYIEPSLHDQKEYFRSITPKNWVWPMGWFQKCTGGKDNGWLRRPRSGLTWFNIIFIGVFQYCCIRVLFTIVSVVTQAFGRYCESSLNPAFAHIWVLGFESASVTIAMFCIIQFYIQLKKDLAEKRPFMKVLCIKLVIFFSFWQSIVISLLVSTNVLKTSATLAYPDIKVGIPNVLLCVEMAIFAILHIWAFSWRPYDLQHSMDGVKHYQGGLLGLKAYVDAWNPYDIIKASARGFRWLFVGAKNRRNDPSYQMKKQSSELPQYSGITFAGNGEPAVESVPPALKNSRDEDRAGLLSNAQSHTRDPSPYGAIRPDGPVHQDSEGDLGNRRANANMQRAPQIPPQNVPSGRFSWEERNTVYHAPPQAPSVYPQQRPLPRPGTPPEHAEWDVWGGVHQQPPPQPRR